MRALGSAQMVGQHTRMVTHIWCGIQSQDKPDFKAQTLGFCHMLWDITSYEFPTPQEGKKGLRVDWLLAQAVAGQCGDISVISVVAAQVVHLLKGASCQLQAPQHAFTLSKAHC